MHCFDWLYLLPLGSAALTPHWTPSGQGPAHELGTGSRALRRESGSLALGLGKAVVEQEEDKEEEPDQQEAAAETRLGGWCRCPGPARSCPAEGRLVRGPQRLRVSLGGGRAGRC